MTKTLLRFGLFFLSLLSVASYGYAQQVIGRGEETVETINISGTVRDASGDPMPGVTVVVGRTGKGTITGEDGSYAMNLVPRGVTLTFSFLGYETRRATADREVVNVSMRESAQEIDRVVVTGYNTTSMSKSTGSVAVVTSEELMTAPTQGVDMLLQGKVAGVSVSAVSGRPGATASVRIRGTNTITGNAEPLWVVDGVPLRKKMPTVNVSGLTYSADMNTFFANAIGGINPRDIDQVTVLKDAAAAAIYGAEAGNGVIVITTKRGTAGRISVNYGADLTWNFRPQGNPNLMNSAQKLAWEQELWDEFSDSRFNAGSNNYPVIGVVGMIRSGKGEFAGMTLAQQDAKIRELSGQSTDWFKTLLRNTFSHNHYLSVSGGGNVATFYTSLGYSNQNGMVKNSGYDSYTFNGKVDIKAHKKITIGFSTDFYSQSARSSLNDKYLMTYAYYANPYEKLYNEDGSYAADRTYQSLSVANGGTDYDHPDGYNIMREIEGIDSRSTSNSIGIIADLRWNIIEGLNFTGKASYNYTTDKSSIYQDLSTNAAYHDRPFETNLGSSKRTYSSMFNSNGATGTYLLRGQVNYGRTIKDHRFSFSGGAEISKSTSTSYYYKRYGYDPVTGNHITPTYPLPADGNISYSELQSYRNILDALAGDSAYDAASASFYLTGSYAFRDKYLIDATFRANGSNYFGRQRQFNPVYAVGLAWHAMDEPWMQPIAHVVSMMTFRFSTGLRGNVNDNMIPQLVMDYSNLMREDGDQMYRMGSVNTPPNPMLRWERNWDIRGALSMGFLKNRIVLDVEYYQSKGMDLITNSAVPDLVGFSSQSFNTSEQINRGLEFSLGGTIVTNDDFYLHVSGNVAYNVNKLTKYVATNIAFGQSLYVGYPTDKLFGGKYIGMNPDTGLYEYQLRPDADIKRVEDYRDSDNYYYYLGRGSAPWTGGISLTFRYKTFSLSMNGVFSGNRKVIDYIDSPASYNNLSTSSTNFIQTHLNDVYTHHLNVLKIATNRWTTSNPRTDANPRLVDAKGEVVLGPDGEVLGARLPGSSTVNNGAFLTDISYFKMSSISMSYSLPQRYIEKIKMKSLSFSVTANNIFTISKYKGLDPETPGAIYPQSRSLSLGISVGF